MGVSAVVGAAVIGASATAYSAHEQKKTAEDAAKNADELAAKAEADRNQISAPGAVASAAQLQMSEQRAASAGGTIVGGGGGIGAVGDLTNQPKKGLLGS